MQCRVWWWRHTESHCTLLGCDDQHCGRQHEVCVIGLTYHYLGMWQYALPRIHIRVRAVVDMLTDVWWRHVESYSCVLR